MKLEAHEHYKTINVDLGDVYHGDMPLFEFKCIKGEMEYVAPGCGCTAVYLKKNGDAFGYLDINQAVGRNLSNGELFNVGVFKKGFTVYLKDDRPAYIKNAKGTQIPNPEKDQVYLTISGIAHEKN